MPRIDSEKFYKSAIDIHGISAKGVNWYSKEYQELRFDLLLETLPEDITGFTIVDAGCGFGDLFLYMEKKNKLPQRYIGIDSLSDMYEIASSRTGCEILIADICNDTIPNADYYLCSGAMNVLNRFETHLFIRRCFEASRYGFIFNILHGDKESETYNYLSSSQIHTIASDLDVDTVLLKDNYLENDITVAFLKAKH